MCNLTISNRLSENDQRFMIQREAFDGLEAYALVQAQGPGEIIRVNGQGGLGHATLSHGMQA
jgi:hypothetical protein